MYRNRNDLDACVCGEERAEIEDRIWHVSKFQDFITPHYYYKCPTCYSYSAVNLYFEEKSYQHVPIERYCIPEKKRNLNRRRVAWICDALAGRLPQNPVIYDLGSGEGAFTAAFKERFPGAEIVSVEADLRMREKFVKEYEGTTFLPEFIEPFLEKAALTPRADIAVLTDVLEHVLDPKALMRALMAALKPGGVAYVTVPNAKCYHWPKPVTAGEIDWEFANTTCQHLWMMDPHFLLDFMNKSGELIEYTRSLERLIRQDGDYSTFLVRRPA